MKLKGTQIFDKNRMDLALKDFQKIGKKKFMKGIMEHNANGTKGLSMMTLTQTLDCAKEEIIDLWFYIHNLELTLEEYRKAGGKYD